MTIDAEKLRHAYLMEEYKYEKVDMDFSATGVFVEEGMRPSLRGLGDEQIICRQAAGVFAGTKATVEERALSTSIVRAVDARFAERDDGEISYAARAGKVVVREAANAAYPKPDDIDRKTRSAYARWQRRLALEGPDVVTVTIKDIGWLRDVLDRDKLGLPLERSQWVEAVLEYCDSLLESTFARLDKPAPALSVAEPALSVAEA